MNRPDIRLGVAVTDDAAAIADVFLRSRRLLTFLPDLHSVEEDAWFIRHVILADCDVLVTERHCGIIAFLALENSHIRLLHTAPEAIGQGAGSLLLSQVQSQASGPLDLWCFQANGGARQFYERHGFSAAEFSDGSRNEEKTPDVRYVWIPPDAR